MMTMISFIAFLVLFVCVGIMSSFKNKRSSQDFLLASRSVKPWMAGLSAVATANSGFMFIGLIGFAYMVGLQSIWLAIGWLAGDFLASMFIHKNLHANSMENNSLSFASAVARWQGVDFKYLRIFGALLTIVFLGMYAAAQLSAGSKALSVLFGWNYSVGAIIGSFMVLVYCLSGGIRASIWTDIVQLFVMIAALLVMVYTTVDAVGGGGAFVSGLHNVSPVYMHLWPTATDWGVFLGPLLFILGWVAGGFGVVGQPQIMVRFMMVNETSDINVMRIYYYSIYALIFAAGICTALAARLLVPDTAAFDAELALPLLAQLLLPEVLVGLVLAGLFSAAISTANAQILCCTAALTHDIAPQQTKWSGYTANKIATVLVTLGSLGISVFGSQSVFLLVLISWSALAAAFAPLMVVLALKQKVSQPTAITMVLTGMLTAIAWRAAGLTDYMYEAAPGIAVGMVVFAMSEIIQRKIK